MFQNKNSEFFGWRHLQSYTICLLSTDLNTLRIGPVLKYGTAYFHTASFWNYCFELWLLACCRASRLWSLKSLDFLLFTRIVYMVLNQHRSQWHIANRILWRKCSFTPVRTGTEVCVTRKRGFLYNLLRFYLFHYYFLYHVNPLCF